MIVRTQRLDGEWVGLGIDTEHGIAPESIDLSGDEGGCTVGQFVLKRKPGRYYPDLVGLAPIEFVEAGDAVRWSGMVRTTPSDDDQVTVQCDGDRRYGELDPYEQAYVHANLADWKDLRSVLTEDLSCCTTGFTVQTDGGIYIAMNKDYVVPGGEKRGGVVLDLGESRARRIVIEVETSRDEGQATVQVQGADLPHSQGLGAGQFEAPVNVLHNAFPVGATSLAATFNTPRRYVQVYLRHAITAGTTIPADRWVRIRRIEVYTDARYESGYMSCLTADQVVEDAIRRVPQWRNPDWEPATLRDVFLGHPRLRSLYRFTESSGTVAEDVGPAAADGTYQNGPILGQAALIDADDDDDPNASVKLEAGMTDRVLLPGLPTNARSWAIAMVFRVDALPTSTDRLALFSAHDSMFDTKSMGLWVDAGGAITASMGNSVTLDVASIAGTIVQGKTHTLVFAVGRGETLLGQTARWLWIDGELVASSTNGLMDADAGTVYVGDYPAFVGATWVRGVTVDELAVYSGGPLRQHDADRIHAAALERPAGGADCKRTGLAIPSYADPRDKSALEHVASANALNGQQFAIRPGRRPVFRPLPDSATMRVGSWGGSRWADAATQPAGEVVNKMRGQGTDGVGSPVRSTRWLSGASPPYAATITQPVNPDAEDPDLSDWTEDSSEFDGALIFEQNTADEGAGTGSFGFRRSGSLAATAAAPGIIGTWASQTVAHKFVKGRRYRFELLVRTRVAGNPSQHKIGWRLTVGSTLLVNEWRPLGDFPSSGPYVLVTMEFIAPEDATGYTVAMGAQANRRVTINDGTVALFDSWLALEGTDDSLPGRRGLTVSRSLQATQPVTQAVLDRICDLYLATHQGAALAGDLEVDRTGVREGSSVVAPGDLLSRTMDLVLLEHVLGDKGERAPAGRIVSVQYRPADGRATCRVDSSRSGWDTLAARFGVQTS